MDKPDYARSNYCIRCNLNFPKSQWKCSKCNKKLRTRPGSSIRNKKYLEMKARL